MLNLSHDDLLIILAVIVLLFFIARPRGSVAAAPAPGFTYTPYYGFGLLVAVLIALIFFHVISALAFGGLGGLILLLILLKIFGVI